MLVDNMKDGIVKFAKFLDQCLPCNNTGYNNNKERRTTIFLPEFEICWKFFHGAKIVNDGIIINKTSSDPVCQHTGQYYENGLFAHQMMHIESKGFRKISKFGYLNLTYYPITMEHLINSITTKRGCSVNEIKATYYARLDTPERVIYEYIKKEFDVELKRLSNEVVTIIENFENEASKLIKIHRSNVLQKELDAVVNRLATRLARSENLVNLDAQTLSLLIGLSARDLNSMIRFKNMLSFNAFRDDLTLNHLDEALDIARIRLIMNK